MAENVLTREIAEQFLAEGDSVDLSEFTELDDDAAESLSKHKGGLYLNGLTSLSDAAAESLSKHKGEFLELDGLTSLSDAAAESLSKHKASLALGGLTQLSDAAAECLARHAGNSLSLGGDTELISLSGSISPTAVLHLTEYMGSLSLEIDTHSREDGPEWRKALSEFGKRPEQRLFLDPTTRMEEVLEQKDTRDWDACEECFDWVINQNDGLSSLETFDALKDLVIKTGMRKLWSVPIEDDDGEWDQFFFIGEESDVLERMIRLPDKTE